jgi:hypothetical protein
VNLLQLEEFFENCKRVELWGECKQIEIVSVARAWGCRSTVDVVNESGVVDGNECESIAGQVKFHFHVQEEGACWV